MGSTPTRSIDFASWTAIRRASEEDERRNAAAAGVGYFGMFLFFFCLVFSIGFSMRCFDVYVEAKPIMMTFVQAVLQPDGGGGGGGGGDSTQLIYK